MVSLTYTYLSGERQQAPATRVLRKATSPSPVLLIILEANFEVSDCCHLLSSSF